MIANNPSAPCFEAPRVAVILAAYNGGNFIEEQIQSIQDQTYQNWVMYVRDDGSSDSTVAKILNIAQKDSRIRLIDDVGNQGAIGNFSILMGVALNEGADYVFLSDQDDVWDSEKMEILLAEIRKLEVKHTSQAPLLVHSDLVVVDGQLTVVADSFVAYSRLSPRASNSGILLFQNQVTGCACVINRALLELATPIPKNVMMHDWWLALLAYSAGEIGFIQQPLVKYRQHGGNVLGAMSYARQLRRLLVSPQKWVEHIGILRRSILQAITLRDRLNVRGIELSPGKMEQINIYSNLLNVPALKRAKLLRDNKISQTEHGSGKILNLLITLMK